MPMASSVTIARITNCAWRPFVAKEVEELLEFIIDKELSAINSRL
jgi:hypothetical protein